MLNPNIILCRAAGDQPLVRRVWSVAEDGVLICTQENFQLWAEENIEPVLVKVPFNAAYRHNEQLFHQLNAIFQPGEDHNSELEALWLKAEPYNGQV